ncbi:MAG TPA: TrbI/VirB10 family protein [Novosphingobium sp.]
MRPTTKLSERFAANDADPRDAQGAEIIDLATRNVLPQVAARKPRSDAFGLAAGVAVVGLLGAVTLWSMDNARTVQKRGPLPTQVGAPPVALPPAVPPQAITPAPGTAPAAPQQQAVLAAPPQMAPGVRANPHSSPTIVFDASALPASAPAIALGGPAAAPGGSGNGNDDFAARLGGVGGGAASAASAIDPRTTVTQGTLIPAVLETAIDTDVPGYVRAIVSADVRSFDGTRVLVPRSSRLIGQYKSGMTSGQKRAYVIWTRLIRPDGVSVAIASPAVAFSGETGLAGKVDSHFFERFGSSMLLSVIGGIPSLIGNGANVIVGGGGQSAAAAAVGQGGQIGPTIRVRQGEPIRVFTARDLDFSKVERE